MPGWAENEYRYDIFAPFYYINAYYRINAELSNNEPRLIQVFDTSLRDGEQTAERAMTERVKIRLTEIFCQMGIDVLEVGFPASAGDHTESITNSGMREKFPTTKVTALARTVNSDIEAAQKALEEVNPGCRVVHTFVATSPDHIKFKLGNKKIDDICAMIKQSIEKITKPKEEDGSNRHIAMFSPEDATSTPIEVLKKVIEVAVRAGATIINIPDTIGIAQPNEVGSLIRKLVVYCEYLRIKYAIKDEIIVSYHGHNDSDLSTANTLAAILNGAKMIQGTLNGIGERSGNTALYKVFKAMIAKPGIFSKYLCNVDFTQIASALKEIDSLLETDVYPEFERQFTHASGIHQSQVAKKIIETLENNPNYIIQDGLIYDEKGHLVEIHDVYQPIKSSDFGFTPEFYGIVLTKHSGIAGLRAVARLLGFNYQIIGESVMNKFRNFVVNNLENYNKKVCTKEDLKEFLKQEEIEKISR